MLKLLIFSKLLLPSTPPLSYRRLLSSTIYALSSGSLPCGVAIVRISGLQSLTALKKLTRRNIEFEPKKMFYTKIYDISECCNSDDERDVLDHAMAVWLPGPHTFTGENTVELFLHGSKAVVNAVCKALNQIEDVEPAKAGEFTKRAFFNGKYSISQVESLNDLINSETESQRKLAIRQNKAGEYLKPVREKLIGLIAQIEASIDFAEDIENQKFNDFSTEAEEILLQLRKFERSAKRGSLIREGIKVALVGKTNVGKSSLMNRLAEKDVAIVSDIAGTTRDYLETRLHLNAVPVTFFDTAGIRDDTQDPLEKEGIRRSFVKAEEANIIVYISDAQKLATSFNDEMKDIVKFLDQQNEREIVLCLNKADLLKNNEKEKLIHRLLPLLKDRNILHIWTSCFEEFGLSSLLKSLDASINDLCNIEGDDVILSRQRHIILLQESITEIQSFLETLTFDQALAAQHLRNAANFIGEISGTIVNEQILDKIFSQFCIGK